MWHWYIRHRCEVLADVDKPRLLELDDLDFEWVPSVTPGHWHGLATLPGAVAPIEAVALALTVGSDPLHAAHDLMRIVGRDLNPILLICTQPFNTRPPDFICNCSNKHATPESMAACPIGKRLRG